MTVAEVAQAVEGRLAPGTDGSGSVAGPVVVDSRQAVPGALFIALRGERTDGHDHIPAAVAAGAVAALAERDTGAPAVLVADAQAALGALARAVLDRLPGTTVIGLTGSSGKTSTKDLLAALLARLGPTIAPAESFNNEIGLPLTALRADRQTRFLVTEMGARGIGHIAYLCRIARPAIGVVLNVGAAHLGEFGGRAGTAAAKGELVEALAPSGLAVLNGDDPLVAAMAQRTRARVLLTGDRGDVRAERVELDQAARARFRLVTPSGAAQVALQSHGAHQVPNSLAAAAVALELGLAPEQIAAGLTEAQPRSRWRMEVGQAPDGLTVINDSYNANPESVAAALRALAAMARPGRKWAVLGEMLELGDAAEAEHRRVGELAVQLGIDRLVAIGTGARPIHLAAAAAGADSLWVADPAAALDALGAAAGPADAVLVKASRAVGLDQLAEQLLAGGAARGAVTAPGVAS